MAEITVAIEYPNKGYGEIIARYDLTDMKKQIEAEVIKDIRAELIESDIVTFSRVIDYLGEKLEQLKEQSNG